MPEARTLANGLKVYVVPKKVPDCSLYLAVHAGSLHDIIPETAHVLEHIAGVQAKIYGDSGSLNYASGNASTYSEETVYCFNGLLAEDLPFAAEALSKALLPPACNALEREKVSVIHELSGKKTPYEILRHAMLRRMRPEMQNYFPNIDTRLASLETITPAVAEQFWQTHYAPANAIVCAVGAIPPKIVSTLENIFERVPARQNDSRAIVWPKRTAIDCQDPIEVACTETLNAEVHIAHTLPWTVNNAFDKIATLGYLKAFLCSTAGPAYTLLRDAKGLCYSCGADYTYDPTGTTFWATAETSRIDQCKEIVSEFRNILADIARNGMPSEVFVQFRKKVRVLRLWEDYQFNMNEFLEELRTGLSITAHQYDRAERMTNNNIKRVAQELVQQQPQVLIALPLKRI